MLDPGSLTVFAGAPEATRRRVLAVGTAASRSGGAVLHVSPEDELPALVRELRRTATVPARTFAWTAPPSHAERPHLAVTWPQALAFSAAIVLLRQSRLLVTLPAGLAARAFTPECEDELRRRGCAILAQTPVAGLHEWLARADSVYRVRPEGGLQRVRRPRRPLARVRRASLG